MWNYASSADRLHLRPLRFGPWNNRLPGGGHSHVEAIRRFRIAMPGDTLP
jgi:hypothetical protein